MNKEPNELIEEIQVIKSFLKTAGDLLEYLRKKQLEARNRLQNIELETECLRDRLEMGRRENKEDKLSQKVYLLYRREKGCAEDEMLGVYATEALARLEAKAYSLLPKDHYIYYVDEQDLII